MDVLLKLDSMDIFKQVMEDILNHMYDLNHTHSNKTIDNSTIRAAKLEIKNIILKTNLEINEVTELLTANHQGNDEKIKYFVSLLEERKSELLNLMLVHYNCGHGETLNNFDWKLKLVCGTSELKTFSYPLLQLALYTVTVNHKSAERLYELNKDMLFRLIGAMEEFVGDTSTN